MVTKQELQAQLRALEALEEAERKARVKAAPIVMKFTIEPTTDRWHEVYDDSCLLYKLEGKVTNREEAKRAGHPDHDLRDGGMTYVFNKLSGRIVTGVGGGTIWIGAGWQTKNAESAHDTMETISRYLVEHPEGGDITYIVEIHRKAVQS